MVPTTKPAPKAGAMVSAARSNAQPAQAAQVPGLGPHDQAKGQLTHHVVMPQPRVHARPTAPVAQSEPARVWALAPVRGLVPVRQAGQPHAAPAATRQIAHVVRLSLTSNLYAYRLAAPACKIHHHEYSN